MKLIFVITYAFLTLVTLAALATPQAIAANILPNDYVGALVMIGSVAILMSALVIEIWRQTGPKAQSDLQEQANTASKNNSRRS